MKDFIGKAKRTNYHCHKKFKKLTYFDQEKIATEFNQFFANVGSILAKQIAESKNTFESYLVKNSSIIFYKSVLINEFRDASLSLKRNKSPGYAKVFLWIYQKPLILLTIHHS